MDGRKTCCEICIIVHVLPVSLGESICILRWIYSKLLFPIRLFTFVTILFHLYSNATCFQVFDVNKLLLIRLFIYVTVLYHLYSNATCFQAFDVNKLFLIRLFTFVTILYNLYSMLSGTECKQACSVSEKINELSEMKRIVGPCHSNS